MDKGVHNVLLKSRVICLNERVNDGEASRISEALILLNAEGDAPITLYINSNGGNTDAGFSIYDMLQHSVAPVTGIVQQKAYSAASVVLQGCHTRKALKHAQLLIHNGSITMDKEFDALGPDLEREVLEVINKCIKKRTIMYDIYAQRTGKSVEEIEEICLAGKELSADEAKDIGLIDEVI
ncbi:MAG: ATP-dependent Clp protease proteolytic subunit [Candidatus Azambacteria bacterium]|nr:ATP-dependent Clp protease proteolytic subunit [Candidatus Azambacteria bacterium]